MGRLFLIALYVVMAATSAGGQIRLASEEVKACRLTVRVIDLTGRVILGALVRVGDKKALVEADGAVLPLTCGQYRIEVTHPGFKAASFTSIVDQHAGHATVVLSVSSDEVQGFHTTISGQVEPGEQSSYVLLVGVQTSFRKEVVVSPRGFFVFEGVPFGRYIVVHMAGSEVRQMRMITVPANGAINLGATTSRP